MGIDEFHREIGSLKSQAVEIKGKKLSLKDFVAYHSAGKSGRIWLWLKSACTPSSVLITKKSIDKAASLFASEKKSYQERLDQLNSTGEGLPLAEKAQKKFTKDYSFLEKTQRVFQNFLSPSNAGSETLSAWLASCKNGYLAHATSKKNAQKIIQEGFLKPSEMLLREGKETEFEMGSTAGARSTTRKVFLEEADIRSLMETRLTTKERARMEELKQRLDITECKKLSRELKSIQAILEDQSLLEKTAQENNMSVADYEDKLVRKAHKITKGPIFRDYVGLKTLQRYQRGFHFTLREKLKFLQDYACGIKHNPESTYPQQIARLAKKYDCTPKEILIALDEAAAPDEKIDNYLAKKYAKGYPRVVLYDARQHHLRHNKLNPEIRMSTDTIFWGYGDVIFLKKKDPTLIGKQEGLEAVLKAPWENNEKFVTLDLKKDPDLLILGPRSLLASHAANLEGKCIFIEDLSLEQLDLLNVPKELRPRPPL